MIIKSELVDNEKQGRRNQGGKGGSRPLGL